LIQVLGGIVAAAAILVVAAAWRFSQGPLSLAPLSPYLQDSLNLVGANSFEARVGDTILTWRGLERGLEILVLDVQLIEPDGRPLVRVPEMALTFDLMELIGGDLIPSSVDVLAPTLRITRARGGELAFGVGDSQLDGRQWIERLERDLLLPPERRALASALRQVSVRSGDVTFIDEERGVSLRFPRFDVRLDRSSAGVLLRALGEVDLGGSVSPFALGAKFDYVGRATDVTVDFGAIDSSRVASLSSELAALGRLNASVEGNLSMRWKAGAVPDDIRFSLSTGRALVDIGPLHPSPLPVARLTFEGMASLSEERIEISSASIDLGAGAMIRFSGSADLNGPNAAVTGTMTGMSVDGLRRHWPAAVAPDGRAWFFANARRGFIDDTSFRITLGPNDFAGGRTLADAIDVRFAFRDLAMNYLGRMPAIEEGVGRGRLTGGSLDVTLERARMGGVGLSEGLVHLEADAAGAWLATVEFVATGKNGDVLKALDSEPLRLASSHGIDANAIDGLSATRAKLRFPLREPILAEYVQFAAAANIRDAAIRGLLPGIEVSRGNMTLELTAREMRLAGTALVNGISAEVAWTEDFLAPRSGPSSRFTVAVGLDDGKRRQLGLDLGEAVRGVIDTQIVLLARDRRPTDIAVSGDLRSSSIEIPMLGWKKAEGVAGNVRFRVVPEADGIRIDDLELAAHGLRVSGRAQLSSEMGFERLALSRLQVGETDVALTLERDADGLRASLVGPKLDATALLDEVGESSNDQGPPLVARFKIGRAKLGEDRHVTGLEGEVSRAQGRLDSMRFAGSLNDEAPVTVAIAKAVDGKRRLTMASANAGRLARAFDFFSDADGGTFLADGILDEDAAGWMIDGRVEIENLKVNKMPMLTRVLSLASLTGIVEVMSGEGIQFVRADVPFRFSRDRIDISGGRAFGPSLGITIDGRVNRANDELTLNGTLVPAYTINSVLGQIPLIGTLLVGRPGEGIIALNYQVRGTLDDPVISVNPLSALAPGFLRNFFAIFTNPPGRNDAQPQIIERRPEPPG
jgi:hypothetical protein